MHFGGVASAWGGEADRRPSFQVSCTDSMMCIDVCQSWGEDGEQERLLAMPGHAKVSASRQMRLMKMEWLSFLVIKSVLFLGPRAIGFRCWRDACGCAGTMFGWQE